MIGFMTPIISGIVNTSFCMRIGSNTLCTSRAKSKPDLLYRSADIPTSTPSYAKSGKRASSLPGMPMTCLLSCIPGKRETCPQFGMGAIWTSA